MGFVLASIHLQEANNSLTLKVGKKWDEFNFKSLYSKFGRLLESRFTSKPPKPPTTSGLDLRIVNEESLEHQILSRDTIPTVNAALDHARSWLKKRYKQPYPLLHIGRGSLCNYNYEDDDRFLCDWAVVSPDYVYDDRKYYNLLPRESKISSKWSSEPSHYDLQPDSASTWRLPPLQLFGYADASQVRYGFIITDAELVVFELSKIAIDPGIAATRPQRFAHARVESADTDLSTSMQATSLNDGTGVTSESYLDNHTGNPVHPRHKTIPWDAQGPKKLTVRLAMFCLCLLAGYGPRDLDAWYPPLDSWSHNTYPYTIDAIPEEELPEIEGVAEEGYDESGDETSGSEDNVATGKMPAASDHGNQDSTSTGPFVYVDGEAFLKRSSVMHDPSTGQDRYVDEEGHIHLVDPTRIVYDDELQEWGYVHNGSWVPYIEDTRAPPAVGGGERSRHGGHRHRRLGSSSKGNESKPKKRRR
ncbi:hypothetical protein CEP52_011625 [Fusarium oligoseptatum]|uniref:Uncharacterized protein n=1 Tax=Fusarium oligoseptatum TaxID=2604345 RepID=A0A428T2B5_9HYPO|nr:hypothetical protein CEP52_011625 [Fusarium oligoseptatum]